MVRPTTNLPVELTSFVGRRDEIEAIRGLIESNRLVSLTGAGGVGKTRLATQVAGGLASRFPDGVWFIDLTATRDDSVVPSLVAAPLAVGDIDTSSVRELTDVLADFLAERRLLLLLDNCEHVLDGVRELVTTLLERCLEVQVLATSRETLGLTGEIVFRVPPLPASSDRLSEAAKLFLDRTAQVSAGYRPGDQAMAAISQIVSKLDGLPLAIELAASRMKLLSPQQILDGLSGSPGFLRGQSTLPDRHVTLQATIEWSYDLLEPDEQDALQRLAVFAGWSMSAAEVALGRDAASLLGSLVDKSLVDVVPGHPANRYRMLETVREYALRRLADAGEEEDTRMRHAAYFLHLAEESDTALRGPDQAQWVSTMKVEHDNVRSALEWALSSGRISMALRFVAGMGRFWFMQTHWKEALRWFDRVTTAAGEEHQLEWARASIKSGAIKLITRGGVADPSDAERAHQILREQGNLSELGMATFNLAEAKQGVAEAPRLIAEAIRLFEQAGDAWGQAYAHRWLGSKVELFGDPAESIAHQRQGIEGFRSLGDRWSAGWLAFDLGFSLLAAGRHHDAGAAFEEAIDLASGLDDRLVVAHAARGLASVSAGLGRLEESRRRFVRAMPLLEQIGDENCTAFSHLYLADVSHGLEEHERGVGHLLSAIEGFTRINSAPGIAAALRRLARHRARAGRDEDAARLLGAAAATELGSAELSPPEQAIHDEVEELLSARLEATELAARRAEGAATPVEELLAGFHADPVLTDESGPAPEGDEGPAFPARYGAFTDHIRSAWNVEGDILVHRALGGKSGASVLAVDLSCEGYSGQAILKLEEVEDPTAGQSEAERHRLAQAEAPEFAAEHLPRVVHSASIAGSTGVLSTIAGRGLEYTLPWARCAYPTQLTAGSQMAAAILGDWNDDYRLADSILAPHQVLHSWLTYRLDPARGRIHSFVEEAGADPRAATVLWEGHWYPNPLAFATGAAPGDRDLGLRPISGHTHGDLHGFNLLVRDRNGDLDWFLIDLAFYTPDAYLFFDHAYFELSHLLETRAAEPLERWMPLLGALAGRADAREDDFGLLSLLTEIRARTKDWVEQNEPDRISYMDSQLLLARVAVGLNFTHKRVPVEIKTRGFLYAMSSLKEFVKFHSVEWPRAGSGLSLAG